DRELRRGPGGSGPPRVRRGAAGGAADPAGEGRRPRRSAAARAPRPACRRTRALMDHLALAVSDQGRSMRFYTHYFGFVPESEPREDGVWILHDDAGFSLAIGEIEEPVVLPRFFHFGRGAAGPEEARVFRDQVDAGGR